MCAVMTAFRTVWVKWKQELNPLVNSGKVFCKVSLIPFWFSVLFLKYREKPIVRDRWKSQGEKWRVRICLTFGEINKEVCDLIP